MVDIKFIENCIEKVRKFDIYPIRFKELNEMKSLTIEYINSLEDGELLYNQSKGYFLISLIDLILREDMISKKEIEKSILLLERSAVVDEEYDAILQGYLVQCYFYCYNSKDFIHKYNNAEEKLIKLKSKDELLDFYLRILELLSKDSGFHEDIDKYLDKAREVIKKNDIKNNGKYYYIIGHIYNNIYNNIVGAIFYLSQALKFAEETKSIQLEIKIRIALGESYRIKGNEENKLEVLIPLLSETKFNCIDNFTKCVIYENIIESYLAMGNFKKASDLIKEMEGLINTTYSLENEHGKLVLLNSKILYLMHKGDNDKNVTPLFEEMLNVYNNIKDRPLFKNMEYTFFNIKGDIKYYLGEYEEAIRIHNLLLKESISKGNRYVMDNYKKLSMDYEKLGDLKNASIFFKKYISLKKEWHERQSNLYTEILLREYDINTKNEEISRLISIRETLSGIRNIDGVTGIYNRRFLDKLMEEAKKDHRDRVLSVIMIDVDFFKKYNDNYGHLKGDDVLRSIGNILNSICNDENKVAIRYGGEEFLCILKDIGYDESIEIAKKILLKVKEAKIEHKYSEISDLLTVSMGITTKKTAKSYLELIKSADEALYIAKNNGRNKYIHTADSR